jgi:hypothetical protein
METSSSFGPLPGSCPCIEPRSISAIASAETFPGLSAGDDPYAAVPAESAGFDHDARRNTEETTGTWSTRQIEEIPSNISIHGASITVTALNLKESESRTR